MQLSSKYSLTDNSISYLLEKGGPARKHLLIMRQSSLCFL